MNCDCKEKIDSELRSKNMRLVGYAMVIPSFKYVPTVATEWIDEQTVQKSKRKNPTKMLASHCPFCGKPTSKEEKK